MVTRIVTVSNVLPSQLPAPAQGQQHYYYDIARGREPSLIGHLVGVIF